MQPLDRLAARLLQFRFDLIEGHIHEGVRDCGVFFVEGGVVDVGVEDQTQPWSSSNFVEEYGETNSSGAEYCGMTRSAEAMQAWRARP